MHTIHHTKAVILKSIGVGETNKRFWLFTEEFGLIVATTQGIRKHGSKLQSQLIDYSIISADLVKGRDIWRLVSATLIHNPLSGHTRSELARPYVRMLASIDRFLAGEGEENRELWNHIESCAFSLSQDLNPKHFDTFAIWKTLVHLGYISDEGDNSFSNITTEMAKRMVKEANEAITHTHL